MIDHLYCMHFFHVHFQLPDYNVVLKKQNSYLRRPLWLRLCIIVQCIICLHLPYSKGRLLEVADRVCNLEKPSLAVGKMHVSSLIRGVVGASCRMTLYSLLWNDPQKGRPISADWLWCREMRLVPFFLSTWLLSLTKVAM